MDEDGFVEKKKTKKINLTQRRAVKKKYKDSFEDFWKNTRLEYEINANKKYDDANIDTMSQSDYLNKKKTAITTAMKKFDDKKEKIYEQYIDNRLADELYLSEINEESPPPVRRLPEVNKVNYVSTSIFSNLEVE